MKYKTIYADPPWHEDGRGKIKRGADRHYPLMLTRDISHLPIRDVIADNAHLYLWTTNNFLEDALKVMDSWGFRYITNIVWFKEGKFGLGQYFRGKTELCLFGKRGHLPLKEDKMMKGVTAIFSQRAKHSEKPEAMREMIERVSYPPFLELFARKETKGWGCWGNETAKKVDL